MNRALQPKYLFFAVALVFAFIFGIYADHITNGISHLGFRIPQKDITRDYVIGVIMSFLFGLSILIWPTPRKDRKTLLILWSIKVFVVLVLMLFYEYTYGLDAYYYFRVARAMTPDSPLRFAVGEGSTNLIILLNSIASVLPTGDSFHASKVICAYVGLAATYILYRAVVNYVGAEYQRLLYVLALFPSLLFWSSTLGKEPFHFFGIALFLYGILSWLKQQRLQSIFIATAGVMLMSIIRIWTGIIFLSPLLFLFMKPVKNVLIRAIVSLVMFSLLFYNFEKISQKFHLDSIDDAFEQATRLSSAWNKGGSALTPPKITDVSDFLAFAPLGVFSVLFRPFPGEVMNLFGWIAGIENIVLLYFLLTSIQKLGKGRLFRDPILPILLITPLVWAICYCTIAYQNLGTAMRFKFQVIPYLVIYIWYIHFKPEDVCAE